MSKNIINKLVKENKEIRYKMKELKQNLENYNVINEAKNKIKYGGNDSWNSNYKEMKESGFDSAIEWVLELLKDKKESPK